MDLSGQLHAPAALSTGNQPPVSTAQEAGWVPEPVWTLWRREKSFAPAWESKPDSSAVQPVA
jgi:hypothetical protein